MSLFQLEVLDCTAISATLEQHIPEPVRIEKKKKSSSAGMHCGAGSSWKGRCSVAGISGESSSTGAEPSFALEAGQTDQDDLWVKMIASRGFDELFSNRAHIRVRRMGELDLKAFKEECKKKYLEDYETKAAEIASSWDVLFKCGAGHGLGGPSPPSAPAGGVLPHFPSDSSGSKT
ncbi:hypothetical protein EJ110_NYTH46098 [Nymphaea thermarum]|nr:hypothetical protein EJ110_NYTH46098 [Nymphaea thermarum]